MEEKENLYALWLEGTLSEEERKAFEQTDDFKMLNNIVGEVNSWSLPPLKYDSPTTHRDRKRPKGKYRFFIYSFVMVVSIGLSYFVATYDGAKKASKIEKTELGQTREVFLPDSTSITLIGKSFLEYNQNEFEKIPVVKIQGIAYVKKKNNNKIRFEISDGVVSANKPTEMQIVSKGLYTDLAIYSGSVDYNSKTCGDLNLKPGQGLRKSEGTNCESYQLPPLGKPTWMVNDFVEFKDTPLWQVCLSLEAKYGVEILLKGKSRKMKFTGRYPNNNKDLAYKIVFETMGLKYAYKDELLVVRRK